MNIQTLHPAPAQIDSERLRPTAETPETAVNAVTGAGEAPGITAAAKTSGSGSEEGGIRGELRDRYAPEKTTKGAGLYSMGKDEDGNPVLRFDSPDKAKEAAGEKTPKEEKEAAKEEQAARQAAEEREAERAKTRTVTNTDRVDRELQELREEAEELAQKLRTATGKEAESIQQKLTLAKIELRIKDNDTYRRANAQVTVEP